MMLGVEVELTPQFRDDLRRYGNVRAQAEARVRRLAAATTTEVEQLGEPASRELARCRKLSVGRDFRMVYTVRGEVVWIIALGPRQNEAVYRAAAERLNEIPDR